MKKYEGMFLVDSDSASKELDKITTHIRDIFQKHQAEVIDIEKWDDRKLAYDIDKHRKGTYILGHFSIPPEQVNVIRDDFMLSETVIRHILLVDTGKKRFLENDETTGSAYPRQKAGNAAPAAPAAPADSSKEAAPAAPADSAPEKEIGEIEPEAPAPETGGSETPPAETI